MLHARGREELQIGTGQFQPSQHLGFTFGPWGVPATLHDEAGNAFPGPGAEQLQSSTARPTSSAEVTRVKPPVEVDTGWSRRRAAAA